MSLRFTQLQCKEVICVNDGRRLGFITDVVVELPEGQICAIIVPGPCRFFGLVGRQEDFRIPWNCIRIIGQDTILVECDFCCKKRIKKGNIFDFLSKI